MKLRSILKATVLVVALGVFNSCSDDEKNKIDRFETPFESFLKGIESSSIQEMFSDGVIYSLGYSFSSKKAGKITKLGVAAPQAGTYSVSLYHGLTYELLASVDVVLTRPQIESEPYGFEYEKLIEAISVEADQCYIVAYEMNAATEEAYMLPTDFAIFQVNGSFINFQGGALGNQGSSPTPLGLPRYFTVDFEIVY